jgi:uncharacterized protein
LIEAVKVEYTSVHSTVLSKGIGTMPTSTEIIDQMASRIVDQFHPRKIILFGSRARHQDAGDSDVDLLVVVDHVEDRRALRVAMRRALNGMGLSKDIILLTRDEYEIKRTIPGTIAYPADREGKVLYAV